MPSSRPWPVRAGAALLLLSLSAGFPRAQEQKPTRIVLHAPAGTARAVHHSLLPSLLQQTPGDALVYYRQAKEELDRVGQDLLNEDHDSWLEIPLDELKKDLLRKELAPYARVLELAEKGARCDRVEWDHLEGLKKQGIGTLLTGIQELRTLARVLVLRARLALAEGDSETFLRTIQTGLAVSRHAAESPTLISAMVGIAIGMMMLGQLDAAVSRPDMPDLYWVLTALPRPFIDLGRAFDGERLMCYGTFPGLLEAMQSRKGRSMTEEQCRKCTEVLVSGLGEKKGSVLERYVLALGIQARHEGAKRFLIAQGWKPEEVAVMPHVQAAILHTALDYELHLDEVARLHRLPLAQAIPRVNEVEKRLGEMKSTPSGSTPIIPLASLFLPATGRVLQARARVERKIDALRCVEAIRRYAASKGRLPASLDAITVVPVPTVDPFTGRPWVYTVKGDTATLTVPTGGALPRDNVPLVYELVLPAR